MKVYAWDDLQGRLISVETRVAMLSQSLAAFATAYGDLGPPSRETVQGFSDVTEELAEEIRAIQEAYVDEANADYFRIKALEAASLPGPARHRIAEKGKSKGERA